MKILIFIFLFLIGPLTFGQEALNIIFQPKFETENLVINKTYLFKTDTLKINSFKCYITNLKYYKNDSLVHVSRKRAHLIDATDSSTYYISEHKFFRFDELRFNIGVDSLTNVSGVYEGDLDPSKGMYWTWQSGYINFKLDGTSSRCPGRKNKFYWHIGGYLPPFNTLRKVSLKLNKSHPRQIYIQLNKLFEEIDVSEVYNVMSPSDKAIRISNKLQLLFKQVP
ncbi:MAG: hypothetical protein HRT67_07425 [Flavobacteriaceae bacterium]|nr:hypothetical protein [Flavobacteriaceae bacterium]